MAAAPYAATARLLLLLLLTCLQCAAVVTATYEEGCATAAQRLSAWGRPTGRCVPVASRDQLEAAVRGIGQQADDLLQPPLVLLTEDVAVAPVPGDDWATIVRQPGEVVVLAGVDTGSATRRNLSFAGGWDSSWLRVRPAVVAAPLPWCRVPSAQPVRTRTPGVESVPQRD